MQGAGKPSVQRSGWELIHGRSDMSPGPGLEALAAKWIQDASRFPHGRTVSDTLAHTFRFALTACVRHLLNEGTPFDDVRSAANLLGASTANLFRGSTPALEQTQRELLAFLREQDIDNELHPDLLIELSTAFAVGFAARSRGIVLAEHDYLAAPVLEAVDRVQLALYDSDARLQNVFDKSSIAMCLSDLNGNLLSANPSLLAMSGYDLEAFLRQTPRHLIAWPSERIVADVKELLAGRRENVTFDTELKHADGHLVDVHLSKTLIREKNGSPAFIITLVEDISERKRMAALSRQANQRVRRLIQNSSDMIAVISHDGVIEFVSPSVQRMLGHSPESLQGKSILDLLVADHRGRLNSILSTGSQKSRAEVQAVHFDGRLRWLEAICTDLTHIAEVRGFVINVRDITDRKDMEQQLEQQALHDSLTGLPNRLAFYKRLERACTQGRASGSAVAVLFLDLVRFKTFNEWLGHRGGDETLVAVGQRLSESLQTGEWVARLGGDEFAILVDDASAEMAEDRARSIQQALARPITVLHRRVSVETRIGIAVSGSHLDKASALLRAADVAHHRAKRREGGAIIIFDQRMHEENLRQIELETDLQAALQHDEIQSCFLPEFDLLSGQVIGAEVLMRWHRPNGNVVLPAEFLPTAEETGLIGQLGEFSFRSCCGTFRSWLDAGIVPDDFYLSFNLSPRETRLPDLVKTIEEILTEHGIDPARIRFEIPESALASSDDNRRRMLLDLDRLGSKVIIDDVGGGPSSLALFKTGPVSGLKVARSFLEEIIQIDPEASMVKAVNKVIGALGIRVTLVGIESQADLERARATGYRGGQGFHLSSPLSDQEMATLLASGAPLCRDGELPGMLRGVPASVNPTTYLSAVTLQALPS